MYVSDTGRIDGQPMNARATEYIRRDSEAARQGKMIGIDPSYGLYGNVVVVGNAEQGLRDVPDRLIDRFAPSPDIPRTGDRVQDQEDLSVSDEVLETWFEPQEAPLPDWWATGPAGSQGYHWFDRDKGDATVSQATDGGWLLFLSAPDIGKPTVEIDLGKAPSAHDALLRARTFVEQGFETIFHDRNEDGMIRFPWQKEPSISTPDVMSHHPKWVAENQGDRTVYYREGDWDGHAAVWRDHGRWSMNYAYDPEYPMQEADLGRVRSEKTALDRAELVLREHYRFVRQSYEDTKAVVNLAQEVEDRTPAEQLAIERLQTAIEENPPPRAPDPDDGWLKVFESEMSDRQQARDPDQDRGY